MDTPQSLTDLASYHFDLPESLIAQDPVFPRDASRLFVLHRKEQRWEHRRFTDLPSYLDSHDRVVANNTRVLKARLLGNRIREEKGQRVVGGRVEFVMLEELSPRVWEGLFHASAKYVAGLKFQIPTPDGHGLHGCIVRSSAESPSGNVIVEFDRDPIESGAGELPLPHYISRSALSDDELKYQTVFSKKLGSAAAPTAGLHFTPEVIEAIKNKGVPWNEITLHVGLGTFRPVKEADIRKHIMHEERYEIPTPVAQDVTRWKKEGGRVLAIGTTSVRTLESAWDQEREELRAGSSRTSIFIYPGHHQFRVVDRLLTNFHLPCSTLLMLVSAFAGKDFVLAAYQEAVREKYRFFSYGDAMLIL